MNKYNEDKDLELNDYSSSLAIYIKDIEKYKVFTQEEEKHYLNLYTQTKRKDVFDFIISSNLRLVLSIASKYTNNHNDLMDLIQVGNLGLIKAVEKYEPSFNTRFSTYATGWIKTKISRYILINYNLIKLPDNIAILLQKMANYRNILLLTENREPTDEEYMEKLKISLKKLKKLYYIRHYKYLISTDQPLNNEEDISIGETIPNEDNRELDSDIIRECESEVLAEAMHKLTPKKEFIIRARYALDGKKSTLLELSQRFNVERHAISYTENTILQQLSENPHLRNIYSIRGEITSPNGIKQILYSNIDKFNGQEIKVLELVHGLYGNHIHTLDNTAEVLKQKKEIILRTKNKALKKVGLFN